MLAFLSGVGGAQNDHPEAEAILTAAEGVFKAMKEKDYRGLWQGLTAKTRDEIVASVIKEAKKREQALNAGEDDLKRDFAEGGTNAQDYWNAYTSVFNPDMVLRESRWSLAEVKKDRAVVSILYRKAEHPALLQLKKEDGAWRVGLEETFSYIRLYLK